MKKNGFTLIELLAVIIVLAVIIAITLVSVSSLLSSSKESLSETQKKTIERSAEIYYLEEGMNEDATCINLSDLISKGYIDSKEVLDPKTQEPFGGSVKITYDANQYSYEYQDTICE